MTTISLGRKIVTLINVFTVEPANQHRHCRICSKRSQAQSAAGLRAR
jgi:hypothetical protein